MEVESQTQNLETKFSLKNTLEPNKHALHIMFLLKVFGEHTHAYEHISLRKAICMHKRAQ